MNIDLHEIPIKEIYKGYLDVLHFKESLYIRINKEMK